MTQLHIPTGSKIGIHAQKPTPELFQHLQRAVDQGTPFPVVKLTQEQTALRDVKERSPQTLTMARIVAHMDGLGGIDDITPGDVPDWADAIMTPIVDYYARNPGLVDFIDIQEIVNEPDPPTEQGWRNMGLVMKACIELGRQRLPGLTWAIGSFNAGTPEWNEIVAFLDAGVLDGARRAGDVILAVHEGVLDPTAPVDQDHGALIPGAPQTPPGGGALFGRVAYIALAAGKNMVPVIVSEGYLQAYGDAAEVQRRAAWVDDLYGNLWYMLALLPFTHSPTGPWRHQNYTSAYDAILQYMTSVRERHNAAPPQETHEPPQPQEPDESLEAFIWRQSKDRDAINPSAALQRAILQAGYVPYSTEFWKEFDGDTYAIQTAFRWDTNQRAVAFVKVPHWHDVRIIHGPDS